MNKNIKTKYRFAIILTTVILSTVGFCVSPDKALNDVSENRTVTIYAAAGTITAIQQIAAVYEQQAGCHVETNFASSSTLAKQIAAGADFDLYLSANSKWMDFVAAKNLIDINTRQDLLSDRLVVIAPSGSTGGFKNHSIEQILSSTSGPIAIGDPMHVPVGMYTQQALQAVGCWSAIQPRIIPAQSVRAAQQLVETGQCQLGIVYRAGAVQSSKVMILGLLDENLHAPVRFSAGAAVNSPNGEQLLDWLKTQTAQKIFLDTGFSILSEVNPALTDITHTTLDNTSSLLSADMNEWQAFLISVKVATACVLAVAAPGIMLGYVLACKSFPGRTLVNAIVHLPLVIPPVVTGYMALIFFGKHSLLGGFLEQTFGISFAFNWLGAVLVASIMGLPLLVRSVKTAMEVVDNRYRYAAGTLGAGPVRTFFTITLPLAGPGILAGLILAFARSLGEFGATAVFVGNIPGKTQTLSLAIYNFLQIPGAEASAMRLVAISVILSFGAMVCSEILLKRMYTLSRIRL